MSINKIILIGLLGKAPEFKKLNNGKNIANFSLATSKTWKDSEGNKKQDTTWHNIICFEPLNKVCQYLDKGSKIYLEGEIKYEKFTTQDGKEVNITKIIGNVIDIIKGKDSLDNNTSPDKHNQDKANGYQPEAEEEFFSDTIPF